MFTSHSAACSGRRLFPVVVDASEGVVVFARVAKRTGLIRKERFHAFLVGQRFRFVCETAAVIPILRGLVPGHDAPPEFIFVAMRSGHWFRSARDELAHAGTSGDVALNLS